MPTRVSQSAMAKSLKYCRIRPTRSWRIGCPRTSIYLEQLAVKRTSWRKVAPGLQRAKPNFFLRGRCDVMTTLARPSTIGHPLSTLCICTINTFIASSPPLLSNYLHHLPWPSQKNLCDHSRTFRFSLRITTCAHTSTSISTRLRIFCPRHLSSPATRCPYSLTSLGSHSRPPLVSTQLLCLVTKASTCAFDLPARLHPQSLRT